MKLSQLIQSEELEIDWLKVTLWKLSTGEFMETEKRYPNIMENKEEQMNAGMELLLKSILKRDLEDEDWKIMEVTKDNVYKLPNHIFMVLIGKVTPKPEEKKN